ncbi:hypothetical protein PPERSA_04630 [Pseudocohnilembus persalinus]|uniref:BZIP domain-containing protein n=1 Tax=Pseudocohnilembus persalinus TaxID=266149 RepID=A0A0V0QNG6_PSEPJ|nr:hypothetical protein PPERSA_04630 [Pseudocohnilembus persalinus]|eukprot:KRX03835.1 hypothetical protein PPERSA_04630 [Pseudocohnilembus persalinus]
MGRVYMDEGEKEVDDDLDIKVNQSEGLDQLGLLKLQANSLGALTATGHTLTDEQKKRYLEEQEDQIVKAQIKKDRQKNKKQKKFNQKKKLKDQQNMQRSPSQNSQKEENQNQQTQQNQNQSLNQTGDESTNNINNSNSIQKIIEKGGEVGLEEKLEKNRESARNSRIRKKIYIELLEQKVLKLSEELEVKKVQLSEKDNYLDKIHYQTRFLDKYYSGQEAFFDKLDGLLKQQKKDQSSINMLLDSMRLRMGVSGKERKDAMNYFFKQYLNIAIPQHLRYIIWSACFNKDIFEVEPDPNKPEWREKLIKLLEPTKQQAQKMQRFKQLLVTEKDNMNEILQNMLDCKQKLLQKMYTIEFAMDEIREYFSPIQAASVMNFLHRNQDNGEYSHPNIWDSLKECQDLQFYEDEDLDTESQNMQKIFKIGKM